MKRDDDLVREILFRIEAEEDHVSAAFSQSLDTSEQGRREFGHVRLLRDAGLLELSGKYGDMVRLTNKGHDFIAAVRDDNIWEKTKNVTSKAGVSTLGVLFDVALAFGKKKIAEIAGLDFQ